MNERTTMNGKPVLTVPAKSVLNLNSGFAHKLLCDGPTFSTGSACAYSCSFCYVPDLMRKSPHLQGVSQKHEDVVIRRSGAVEALRRQLVDSRGQPRFADPADRRVVYASPLVDVAANLELVRETVECCKLILELTHWQIRLLSKSNLITRIADELTDHRARVIYGVSTGTLNDRTAAAFESGTPLVSKRIQALHQLQEEGFRTFGMICPSLPGGPAEDYFELCSMFAHEIRAHLCEYVWAEVLNVRGESMTRTIKWLSDSGLGYAAQCVHRVSTDKMEWELYARATFEGHAAVYRGHKGPDGSPKLRFLQYVTAASRPWWENRKEDGAILL